MVMLNRKLPKYWHIKYSKTSIMNLTPGTINWYKYCEKLGRREYLKRSREKTVRFNEKHPGNLQFRVFKTRVLKEFNVSNELFLKCKNKIEKYNSVRGMKKYVKIMKSKESLVK